MILENTTVLDKRIEIVQKEINAVMEQNRSLIREQATMSISTAKFDERAVIADKRFTAANTRPTKLKAKKHTGLPEARRSVGF